MRLTDVQWHRPRQWDLTWVDSSYVTAEQQQGTHRFKRKPFLLCVFFFLFCFVSSADDPSHPGVWGHHLLSGAVYLCASRARIFSPGANCPPCSAAQGRQQHQSTACSMPFCLSPALSVTLLTSALPSSSASTGPECLGVPVLYEGSFKSKGWLHVLTKHWPYPVSCVCAVLQENVVSDEGPMFVEHW